MLKNTGSRLFAALFGYMALVLLLITFNPFYFAWPDRVHVTWDSSRQNLVQNIVLFLPVGFLYRLTTGRRDALLLGAVMSIGIEAAQLFIPARTTSAIDVLANALGAGLGALACNLLSNRISLTSGMVSRLRLETPLMGLLYLLIPLLWINTLALSDAPQRWILTASIGACGAIVFGDLFRYWKTENKRQSIAYASLAAGLWFLVGIGLQVEQRRMAIVALGIFLLALLLTALPPNRSERRFERSTLIKLLPVFGLYLILLTFWFPLRPFGIWHGTFGYANRITATSTQFLYSRVESLVAFTVLGYTIAEWRGRFELTLHQDLPRVVLIAGSLAAILEFLSGFQSGQGASLVRLALSVTGATFGGILYHLSRAHIRFLLGR